MKTRLEVRIDDDIVEALKNLASEADISMNQLMNGICQWAAKYGQTGGPIAKDEHTIISTDAPNTVWFGEPETMFDSENNIVKKAVVYFALNYSDKRALFDDSKPIW